MTLANTPAGSPEESSGDAVQTLMTARLPGPGGRSKAPPKGLAALETVAAQVQLYDSAACSDDDEQEEQSADAKKAPKDGGEKPWLETMWPPAGTPQRRAFVARTAASWALLAATMALYIMVFTAMGAGLTVYEALLPAKTYALFCYLSGGVVLCVAYCTDIEAWSPSLNWLRIKVAAEVFIFFFLAVLLSQDMYPEAAHVFMAVILPMGQAVLKQMFLPNADLLSLMRALAFGFAATGAIVIAVFIAWAASHSAGGLFNALTAVQTQMGTATMTGPTFMFAGPFMLGLWCLLLATLAYFVSNSSDPEGHSAGGQMLGFGLLFSLLCSWTAAQVGAVQMHIADVMQILCGAGMASTGLIACAALGWEGVTTHPKVMAALSARHGDWMRAILVSFLALPYVAFLPLSVLNQAVRTRLWCGAAADKGMWVTPVVATQLHDMRAWNWSSVGPKAMRVALGFICIIVGLQKCLTLFFVWFIAAVSSTPPGATLAIFVGTGVGLLYLIPWMAAVPLYLTGGVVITAAFREYTGFWIAAAASVAVCTFTKALSVYALHQALGAKWMKQANARKDFELRSIRMRAMEMILLRSCFDKAKLYLLVAGPDWLTAVLAGMLGTNVWHILAAQTLPSAFLLSLPASLAGAFQLRLRDAGFYGPVSSALIFVAAAVQGVGIVFFYSQINKVAAEHESELRDKPNDREVEELEELFERTEAPIIRAVEERVDWRGDQLPLAQRMAIVVGVATMGVACTLVRYASKSCFTRFQINDSVSCPHPGDEMNPRKLHTRNCLHGDGLLLVKLLGWVVLGLFAIGFTCYRSFFYYCHLLRLGLKASGEVHPVDSKEEAAEVGSAGRVARPRGKANPIMEIDLFGTAPQMANAETVEAGCEKSTALTSIHLHHLHRLSDLSAATGSSLHL